MSKPLDMNRMYSLLMVKKVDGELRMLSGIATTPTPDRMGDIVEPKGIQFKNPMPLLWQHRHDKPVGEVRFKKPTDEGIEFDAKILKSEGVESAALRERLDEAWDSVKLGLVRGVSIGFIPLEFNFMKDGGLRIEKSEVMELSLVTIPANAEATILQVKTADLRAALGASGGLVMLAKDRDKVINHTVASDRIDSNIAPAAREKINAPEAQKEKHMAPRSIADQLSAFEAKRAANVARMKAIVDTADEAGSTLEPAAKEEFETLTADNKSIDEHLAHLKVMDAENKRQTIIVDAEAERKKLGAPGEFVAPSRVVSVKANVPPGTAFIRLAMALAAGRGDLFRSIRYAKASTQYGGWDNTPEVLKILDECDDLPGMMQKAAIGAGTTTDATWAAPLIAYTQAAAEYIQLLRPATIIGRIPGLRQVPFNIQIPRATAGTTVGWVGENAPKPVANMQFDSITLRWAKAAGIVIITQELARFSNPSAEAIVRNDMIEQMAQFLDRQFVDPSVAAVTNVSPASITNGVTPVTATGTNDAAFRTDAKTVLNAFLMASLSTAGGVWIGTQQQALAFSLMLNALGQASYPTMTPTGGTLLGYPYIASENIPSTTGSPVEGYPLIFAVAPEILLADDGQVVIDASNQASVNMDSAPDSPPTASTNMVSLWQMNLTGIRAERWINWLKRRSTAVGFIQNARYV